MTPRQLPTSPEHEYLVQQSLLRLVTGVPNLVVINIGLEMGSISAHLEIDTFSGKGGRYDVSQYSSKRFQPDILALQEIGSHMKNEINRQVKVTDLGIWVIEAETTPHNLLTDTYRRTAYKLLKLREENVLHPMTLVLSTFKDLDIPEKVDPFDRVWRFKREATLKTRAPSM